MNGNHMKRGLVLAFAGSVFLSFDAVFLTAIGANPLTMAFWRGALMGLAGAIICLILLARKQTLALPVDGRGILISALYGASSIGFVTSALLTTVENLLIILATAPLWAAVGAFLFLRERTPLSTLACSFLSLIGIFIVVMPITSSGHQLGDLVALFTTWCMAAAFVYSRRSTKNIALAPALGGLLSALALALSPFLTSFTVDTVQQASLMAIEGAIIVPLGLGLIAWAPRYIPATQVGLFLLLQTVLGPLWMWLFLSVAPSENALIGGAIVLACLIANSIFLLAAEKREAREKQGKPMSPSPKPLTP